MANSEATSSIGAMLRGARVDRGVSQSSLAIRTGVPQSAISRIETGREIPSLERWARLLAGLGLRPKTELVPLAEPPSEPQHSAAARRLTSEERLELAVSWIRLAEEVRGKAKRPA